MDISFCKIFLTPLFLFLFIELSAEEPDNSEIIYSWRLNDLFTEKVNAEIDTTISSFQIHNPVFRHSISSSYLGNAGLAAMSNIFSDRRFCSDFFFINPFLVYLQRPRETKYYNTKRPFSLVSFSTGGPTDKNEKMLDILHTQNVNPDFNLGFRYFNINSEGQYQNQEAITNAISLFSSYELDNYQLHASLNLNSARVFENGGLVDEESLYNENFETEDHAVRLQGARNGVRNNSVFVSQSLQPFMYAVNDTLPDSEPSWLQRFKLYHVLHYDQYKRTYQDNNPVSGFYPEVIIDNSQTYDSVFYRSLTNTLIIQLPEFKRGKVNFIARTGIKNELLKGSYNILPDTVFHFAAPGHADYFPAEPADTTIRFRNEKKYSSNAIVAVARGSIGEVFGIWGEGSFFFHGRRTGEYDLHAGISLNLFEGKNRSQLKSGIRQKESTPSMFMESFSSNHFSWDNEFRRTGESTAIVSLKMPQRKLEVSADFILLNNYIYFDSVAYPRQHGEVFPVIGFSFDKEFQLWRFHFRNIIEYQYSGNNDILPLPELSVYQSTWYEQRLIRDIMTLQIGFDVYFNTEYQGYAYQPAISVFHLQNESLMGNYPFLDVFINIKHKRARIFFKGEHLNAGFTEPEYFSVLHYPRNRQMFKLGFSWSFYN
ncbi:MAG: putative porin [Bacteroidales bacterium]